MPTGSAAGATWERQEDEDPREGKLRTMGNQEQGRLIAQEMERQGHWGPALRLCSHRPALGQSTPKFLPPEGARSGKAGAGLGSCGKGGSVGVTGGDARAEGQPWNRKELGRGGCR